MKVVVTGIAGFIGYHVARALIARGDRVVGVDNLDPYYSVALKRDRLADLARVGAFDHLNADVSDLAAMRELFAVHADATHVVHLAAQAGVRHSIAHPEAFVRANVDGQLAVLEAARGLDRLEHLVYASSSSVYGANREVPFSVAHRVTSPVSVYAATKLAGEHLAEAYASLYRMPCTGLRFFTVYGPWGRPDMATWHFTRAIRAGEPIALFNRGEMERDFTYVDDVVQAVLAALTRPPTPNAAGAPHKLYNVGNHRPTRLRDFVAVLERAIGKPAIVRLEPMQPGDVERTWADIDETRRDLGFEPRTSVEEGLPRFVEWFDRYHR